MLVENVASLHTSVALMLCIFYILVIIEIFTYVAFSVPSGGEAHPFTRLLHVYPHFS